MNLEDRTLITAKLESVYGTDLVPTAAANSIEVFELVTHTIEAEKKERKASMPYGGTLAPKNIATAQKLSFKIFLKGSGTAGTPPAIDPILRSCRLARTVVTSTSVSYLRHSDKTEDSCTIYYYEDGLLKKVTGCIGVIKATHQVGDYLIADVEMTGLYTDAFVSDTALPTPTFEATEPLIIESGNFTFGAVDDLIISKFEWDLGHEVIKRPDFNSPKGIYGYYSKNAKAPSGSFDPEVVALADWDPYDIALESTQNDISIQVGSTAGNIVEIDLNNTVLEYPTTGSRDGIKTYECKFSAHITNTAGNNEFALIFT